MERGWERASRGTGRSTADDVVALHAEGEALGEAARGALAARRQRHLAAPAVRAAHLLHARALCQCAAGLQLSPLLLSSSCLMMMEQREILI